MMLFTDARAERSMSHKRQAWVGLVSLLLIACMELKPVGVPSGRGTTERPIPQAARAQSNAPEVLPERCGDQKAAAECFPRGQVHAALTAIWPNVLLCLPPRTSEPEDHIRSTAILRLRFDADGGIGDVSVEKESGLLDPRVANCAAKAARSIELQPACGGSFRCTLKMTHGF